MAVQGAGQGVFNPFVVGKTDTTQSAQQVAQQQKLLDEAFRKGYTQVAEMGALEQAQRAREEQIKGAKQTNALNQIQIQRQQELGGLVTDATRAELEANLAKNKELQKAIDDPLYALKKTGAGMGLDVSKIVVEPERRVAPTPEQFETGVATEAGKAAAPFEAEIQALRPKAGEIQMDEASLADRINELEARKKAVAVGPLRVAAGEEAASVVRGAQDQIDTEIAQLRAAQDLARAQRARDEAITAKRTELQALPVEARTAQFGTVQPAKVLTAQDPGYGAALASQIQERMLGTKLAEAQIERFAKTTPGALPEHLQKAVEQGTDQWIKNQAVTDFYKVVPNYLSILSLTDPNNHTPQSDVAAVYAYIRMLDPGSVVREGEVKLSTDLPRSVVTRIMNVWDRTFQGTRMTDGQRADMRNQTELLMGSRMDALKVPATQVLQGFSNVPSTTGQFNNAAEQIIGPDTLNMLQTWSEQGRVELPDFDSALRTAQGIQAQMTGATPQSAGTARPVTAQPPPGSARMPAAPSAPSVGAVIKTRDGRQVRVKQVAPDGTIVDYDILQ